MTIRVLLIALFLALAGLATPRSASAHEECGSTCLDVCQTAGDDLVDACECSFGCGCLCASFANGLTCADWPGCSSEGTCPVTAERAARDTRWGLTRWPARAVVRIVRLRAWWVV